VWCGMDRHSTHGADLLIVVGAGLCPSDGGG
jgi:hypothetical protein